MGYIEIIDSKNRCNPFTNIVNELDRLITYVILLQKQIINLSIHDTSCVYNINGSTCDCSVAKTINEQF